MDGISECIFVGVVEGCMVTVGTCEGKINGVHEGANDTDGLFERDGTFEGQFVGAAVGDRDGDVDGISEAESVGATVGNKDGDDDGCFDGSIDGCCDGDDVGEEVILSGTSIPMNPTQCQQLNK